MRHFASFAAPIVLAVATALAGAPGLAQGGSPDPAPTSTPEPDPSPTPAPSPTLPITCQERDPDDLTTPEARRCTLDGGLAVTGRTRITAASGTVDDPTHALTIDSGEGGHDVGLRINGAAGSLSTLDLAKAQSSGNYLRIIGPNGRTITQIGSGGQFETVAWVTISGQVSDAGPNRVFLHPTERPYMLGVWSDVLGPTAVFRANQYGTEGESWPVTIIDGQGRETLRIVSGGDILMGNISGDRIVDGERLQLRLGRYGDTGFLVSSNDPALDPAHFLTQAGGFYGGLTAGGATVPLLALGTGTSGIRIGNGALPVTIDTGSAAATFTGSIVPRIASRSELNDTPATVGAIAYCLDCQIGGGLVIGTATGWSNLAGLDQTAGLALDTIGRIGAVLAAGPAPVGAVAAEASATGVRALALGDGAAAEGERALALGAGAQATATAAIGIGTGAQASGERALALGSGAQATAIGAVALGAGSVATDSYTVSIGSGTQQRRLVNLAAGVDATDAVTKGQLDAVRGAVDQVRSATETASVQMAGLVVNGAAATATASGAAAVGDDAKALAANATALGHVATAGGAGATAIGSQAGAAAPSTVAIGAASTANGFGAIAFGADSNASGYQAMAFGLYARAIGDRSTAIGRASSSAGAASLAIGQLASTSGDEAVAIGSGAIAATLRSAAFGAGSYVWGASAVAVGPGAYVRADGGGAFGTGARATGQHATALGYDAFASALNAVAIGARARATQADSIVLGSAGTSYFLPGLVAATPNAGQYLLAIGADGKVGVVAASSFAPSAPATTTPSTGGSTGSASGTQSAAREAVAVAATSAPAPAAGSFAGPRQEAPVDEAAQYAAAAAREGVGSGETAGEALATLSALIDAAPTPAAASALPLAVTPVDVSQFQLLESRVGSLEQRTDVLERQLMRDQRALNGGVAAAMAMAGTIIIPDKALTASVNLSTFRGEQGFSGAVTGRLSDRLYVSGAVAGSTVKKSTGGRVGMAVGF